MNKRDFIKVVATGIAGVSGGGATMLGQTAASSDTPRTPRMPRLHMVSRETAPWQSAAAPQPVAPADRQAVDLVVTDRLTVTWQGFGACFNELGWRALSHLESAQREEVLDQLFRPDGDLRFEFCRLPIGANDYSTDWYSHDEVPGDFELTHFSIERDRRALLPFLRSALARRPDLALFASPWSPPTWMKNPAVYNFGKLINEPRYLDAYARYFVKFLEAYRAEGIRIQQVHVQNEPINFQKFPSCMMTGDEMRQFIGRHLGPALERAGNPAELWLGTLNGPDAEEKRPGSGTGFNDYAFTVMEDPVARPFVRGISYQWGGKSVVARTRLAYPDTPLIQSENECGDGANSWRYAWYVADLFHHYLSNDVSGYCYWNMVLEPGGSSTWGWAQNSLLTVDPAKRSLTVNPEFHVMRHYSHFISRGDRRCVCERAWAANAVAYRKADGSTTVVLRNPLPRERTLKIQCDAATWAVTVPAQSLNTLVFT